MQLGGFGQKGLQGQQGDRSFNCAHRSLLRSLKGQDLAGGGGGFSVPVSRR